MSDQSQNEPAGRPADDRPAPTSELPVVLAPDAPIDVLPPAPPPPPSPPPAPVHTSPPPAPVVSDPPEWRPEDNPSSGGPAALAAERPEVAAGAAFVGGLVLALILKRLAR